MGREIVQEDNGQEETVADEGGKALATTGQTQIQREKVGGLMRPAASSKELMEAQKELEEIITTNLEEGRDYGTVPGTNKPSLYKPGAESINSAFGVMPRYRIVEKECDHDREVEWTKEKWSKADKPDDATIEEMEAAGTGRWRKFSGQWVWQARNDEHGVSRGLYRYVIECELVHRGSGATIAQGMGSCSTMESKYIDRPRDLENTIIKMAQKRAYIAATLNAYGLSDRFTQDVEDNPEAFGGSSGGGSSSSSSGGGSSDPGRYGQNIQDRDAFLDHVLESGKYSKEKAGREWSWRDLCAAGGDERGYVRWAIGDTGADGMDFLDEQHRQWLREAADAAKAVEENQEQHDAFRASEEAEQTGQSTGPDLASYEQRTKLERYLKHPDVESQPEVFNTIEKRLKDGGLTSDSAEKMLKQLEENVGPADGGPGPFDTEDDLPF